MDRLIGLSRTLLAANISRTALSRPSTTATIPSRTPCALMLLLLSAVQHCGAKASNCWPPSDQGVGAARWLRLLS